MNPTKRNVLIFSFIISLFLYLAGVASGLFANKLLEKKTSENFKALEAVANGTVFQIENVKESLHLVDEQLKTIQLQQSFTDGLSGKNKCEFLRISLKDNFEDLQYYWRRLPYRLEEYEKTHKLTPEYVSLKKQYTQLEIRTWIIAKQLYDECQFPILQGLYFYSKDCGVCVKQGEELDKLSNHTSYEVVILPIDLYSENRMVKLLKEFYNISVTPAFVVNDKVFQGQLFTYQEILNQTVSDK